MLSGVKRQWHDLKRIRITFAMIFCLLVPAQVPAQEFTARSLGDYGNVTVMDVTGNYGVTTLNGSAEETLPRQIIAQEFFKSHKDEYDFLVIFSNFDFQMPPGARAFYQGVRNDTGGIGIDPIDNTVSYGSDGKLQGTVDMGNIGLLAADPLDPKFNDTLYVMSHEIMHRWASYVKFRNPDGSLSSALLGRDGFHWSFLLDSGGSLMYGNRWQNNGNGTFTSTTPPEQMKFYSPLDLYLMGMIGPEKVPPMLLIENPSIDPKRLPEAGVTISGMARYVTIDDIIATEGPRIPGAASSQKSFKTAFILITRPGTFKGDDIYGIENIRNGWVTRYSVLTDGQGIVEVAATPREDVPVNPGVVPPPVEPRVLPPSMEEGVAWLMSNQRPDGTWLDLGQTLERDTAETTLVLRNFEIARQSYLSGLAWLKTGTSGNMDYLSRKLEALAASGEDITTLLQELLSRRNEDGGWGSNGNYSSNAADTALALKALTVAGYADQSVLSKAVHYLMSSQKADGGWTGNGESTIQATTHTLSAFNALRGAYPLDEQIARGTAWLISKQNTDGGFGPSTGSGQGATSTVYETAMAVTVLTELDAPKDATRKALDYILSQQSLDGSWNVSAYQTALAVKAVLAATITPDLTVTSEDVSFIPEAIRSLPSTIVINANIRNLGRTGAQATVALYEGPPALGNKIGEQTLFFPGLAYTAVTFSATVPDGNERVYYIVADPSDLIKEPNEQNNSAVKTLYVETTYDLEILPSGVAVSPVVTDLFRDVKISAKISNKGTMTAYNAQVRYFIEEEGALIEIATRTVDVPANGTITDEITWRANRAGADLAVTVQADPLDNFAELSETNNKASTPLTVNLDTRPNLTTSYKDIVITPSPANEGGNASISILVKNEGYSPAANIAVNVYNGAPWLSGALLGSRTVPSLNRGEGAALSLDWTAIGEAGEKVIYVQVDPGNQIDEASETDNDSFTMLTVLSIPDLAVSANSIVFTPSAPKDGDPVTIAVTVQNRGEQDAVSVPIVVSENGAVIGSRTVPLIAGNSVAGFTVPYDTSGKSGSHQVTVTVDPDNAISEQSEDNNSAARAFTVQDAQLWVSEKYISPNGDGVKDSTNFFFRLDAPTGVSVSVLNEKGEAVRTFAGGELDNTVGTTVTWDGLDGQGRIVADGSYIFKVRSTEGVVFGSLSVVVDTNRSPLTDAFGTKYLLHNNLSCMLPDITNWEWLPDDSGVIVSIPYTPAYPNGIYYISPDGVDVVRLVPGDWVEVSNSNKYTYGAFDLSPDGEYIAFVLKKYDTQTLMQTAELWIMDQDGSNLHLLDSVSGERFSRSGHIFDVKWSPRGDVLVYRSSRGYAEELWLIRPDGSGKLQLESGGYSYYLSWSPDGGRIVYVHGSYDAAWNFIERIKVTDLAGNKLQVFSDIREIDYTFVNSLAWLNPQKIILGIYGAWPDVYTVWLVDPEGNTAPVKAGTYDRNVPLISIAPGGGFFAFNLDDNSRTIIVDGEGNVQERNARTGDANCVPGLSDVVWSQDGRTAAFSERLIARGDFSEECMDSFGPHVIIVDAETKAERSFENSMEPLAWANGGASLLGTSPAGPDTGPLMVSLNPESGDFKSAPMPTGAQMSYDERLISPLGRYLVYSQWVDPSSACWRGGWTESDLWATGSALNLTSELRITKQKSGLLLKGIAADLNFEGYSLEYADVKTPHTWNPVLPPSDLQVINDVFTAWIPPRPGTYYVRLTVWDKAGNVARSRKRVSWGILSSIANLRLSTKIFSPNSDGTLDTVELSYTVYEPVNLEFLIFDAENNLLRTLTRSYPAAAEGSVIWDGRNEKGSVMPDGQYVIRIFDLDFGVEVDNTYPETHVSMEMRMVAMDLPDPAPYVPAVQLSFNAKDKNLKIWKGESGEGDNPQKWQFITSGSESTDSGAVAHFYVMDEISDIVGRKVRITAEDHAGNAKTSVREMLEEGIDLYQWDEGCRGEGCDRLFNLSLPEVYELKTAFSPAIDIKKALPGVHLIAGLETIRKPLVSLNLQYTYDLDVLKNESRSWIDDAVVSDPVDIWFATWDNSSFEPYMAYAVRMKGVDEIGRTFYSNTYKHELFKIMENCDEKTPLVGEIALLEPLSTLKLQWGRGHKPTNPDAKWQDDINVYKLYDTQKGDRMPKGYFEPPLPPISIEPGETILIRMLGTTMTGRKIDQVIEYPTKSCGLHVPLLANHYDAKSCGGISDKVNIASAYLDYATEKDHQRQLQNSTYQQLIATLNDNEPIELSYFILMPDGVRLLKRVDNTAEIMKIWMENHGLKFDLSTADLPEARYSIVARLTYRDLVNNVIETTWNKLYVPVDRTLPEADLTRPEDSSRVCAVKVETREGLRPTVPIWGNAWYGVTLDGIAVQNGVFNIYIKPSKDPDDPLTEWSQARSITYNDDGQLEETDFTGGLEIYKRERNLGPLLVSAYGGEISLKLEVVSVTGNKSCTTSHFTVLSSTREISVTTDRNLISGIGPINTAEIRYSVNEPALVDVNVFTIGVDPITKRNILIHPPVRTLVSREQYTGGMKIMSWDGLNDANQPVPDGRYGMAVSAGDACENTDQAWKEIEVDNTPPTVAITRPALGDTLGTTTVEIRGTAADKNIQAYLLEAGEGDSPGDWKIITMQSRQVNDDVLGVWNTFGLRNGPWTLRLKALDAVGNEAITTLIVNLSDRKTLIKDLTAAPRLFSPNSDGKLDTSVISYEITDAASISIDVLNEGGTIERTYSTVHPSGGTYTYSFAGRNTAGTVLADGTYNVRVTAALTSDPSVRQAEALTIIIDTTAPFIDLKEPLNNGYLKTNVTVSGSISDQNILEYSLSNIGGSGSVLVDKADQSRTDYVFGTLVDLAEGGYTLHVQAKDLAGNETVRDIPYTIDRTPPAVKLDTPKSSEFFGMEKGIVAVSGGIVETNLESFSLRYGTGDNPAQWTELLTGNAVPVNPQLFAWKVGKDDGVPDGTYAFSLFAKDKAGSTGETRTTITVDNTPPEAVLTSPKEGDYVKAAIDVSGTAFDQNLNKYTLEISEGRCDTAYKWATIQTAAVSVQNGVLARWQALPPDNDYCIKLTAMDKLGSRAEALANVKVDTQPPASPVLSGQVVNRTNTQLTWASNTEPDVAGYNLYRNGQKINASLFTDLTFLDQNLTEGVYFYTLTAVDFAGWESRASNEVKLKIDLTGPEAQIRSPQDNSTVSDLVDIKGTAFSAEDFKQYRVSVGRGTEPSSWDLIRTSPLPTTFGVLAQWDTFGLAEGEVYSIKLEAEDTSGNVTIRRITIMIDNTPPQAPVLTSATGNESSATIIWNANAESDLAGYLLYRNDRLANAPSDIVTEDLRPYMMTCTGFYNYSLPDGTFTFSVVAVDFAGNMSDPSNSIQVTIDTHAPHAEIMEPKKGSKFDRKILVLAESADQDVASVRFQFKRPQDAAWSDLGGPVSVQPYATYLDPVALGMTYGDYLLKAAATDTSGKADPAPSEITVTYADVTAPPVPAGLAVRTNGSNATLTWTANADPDTAGYNIYRAVNGARTRITGALVPKETTVYPDGSLADGVYAYEITAVDVSLNESRPSTPASANIYAPLLGLPLTPTAKKDIRVEGSNAAANSAVEILVQDVAGSGPRGTATADSSGNFTLDIILTPGESSITAKATDTAGNVSRLSDPVVVAYDMAPAAPAGLAASVQGTTITLTWSQNTESDVVGYHAYRHAGQDWVKLNGAPIQSLAYDDINRPNGVHTYRVTAVDSIGSESLPSNEASAPVSIVPPQPPVNLTVTATQNGELALSWDYPAGTAAGYNLFRSEVSGGPYAKINDGPAISIPSYLDNGLTAGTTYYYVVTAVDAAGNESIYSNEGEGVPSDTIAPSQPVITLPATAGSPITVFSPLADVSGTTDPGTTVELFRNGLSAGTTVAKEGSNVLRYALDLNIGDASLSPDGSLLAYSASGSIWIQELATSSVTEIIPGGSSPLWSPDGSKIAYHFSDSDWNYRIGIFDRATGSHMSLTDDPSVSEQTFSWSSDGTKIAFTSYETILYTSQVRLKDLASGALTTVIGQDGIVSHKLSPDGDKLAYFEGSNLSVLDLATGGTVLIDPDSDGWTLDWSPDSAKIMFVSMGSGSSVVSTADIATGDRVPIIDAAGSDWWHQWTLDGKDILFARWDDPSSTDSIWSAPASGQGQPRLIEQGLPGLYYLASTRSGGIAYVNVNRDENWNATDAALKIASSGGVFEFKDVSLDPGENVFYAVASDRAGNASPASEPISVTLDISQMPDLAVSDGDIYLYPLAPVAGEQMSVNVSVWNRGQASVANANADIYLWNALGELELLKSEQLPAMEPGSAALLTASWDSTGKTGENRLVVVVDPYDLIAEQSESNNMAIRDFFVAGQEGLSMATTLDAAEYGSNQNAQISILLRNSGPVKETTLEVLIEDENGNPVTAFDPKTITLAYASESRQSLSWNTGTTFAGSFRVHAVLKNATGVFAENIVSLIIVPDRTVDASVVTDKAVYGPWENVAVLATLTNNGANFILPELKAKMTISDSSGAMLFSDEKIMTNVLPGARITFDASWNTGLSMPGDYTASLGVYLEGELLTTKSAAFRILPSVNFTGNITAEPSTVAIGSSVQAVAAITNTGNTNAPGFTVRIMVVDPETQAVLNSHEETADLAASGTWQGRFAFSTEGYGLKTYTVLLQSIYQGVIRNLNSTSFTVKDLTSPIVTVVSPIADTIHNATVPIVVVATDNASGVDKVEYQVDGSQWKLIPIADLTQGRYAMTWEPSLADNGPHTVSFRASDKAGNTSTAVSVGFVVQMDDVPPVTTITVGAPKYEQSGMIFVTGSTVFSLNATDNFSGVARTEYRTDGGPWTPYAPFSIAAEGSHLIEYRSEDNAGNLESTKNLSIVADNTPPVTDITIGVPKFNASDGKLYISGSTTITLTAADNLSGIGKTEYRINGGQWQQYAPFTVPGEGSHVINYRSFDNLGIGEEERALSLNVDPSPPITSISASDPLVEGVVNPVSPATFFTLSSLDALSGVRTIAYRIDDGAWQAYNGSFFLTGMSAGPHTISYKAVDNVLNEEAVQTMTVRMIILDVMKKIDTSATVLVGMRHEHDCDKEDHDDEDDEDEKTHRTEKHDGKHGGDDHDRCRKDDRCDERQKRVSDILTAAGITHHIAENEDDFAASHRSGKYNTYLLVDFKEEDIAGEIREAVYSGTGLIFVKTLPYADPGLDEAFGVKFTGRTTDSDLTVALADSPVSNEGGLDITGKGVVASVIGQSVQVFASMEDKHGSYPAIVFNQYGKGGVLLYTFDILSVPDQSHAAALLVNSVNHVHPLENLSDSVKPVRIQVMNTTEPVDIKVTEYLPAGTKADAIAPPALEGDGTLAWQAILSGGGKALFGYSLTFPDTAGNVEVVTEVAYDNNGNYRLYGRYGLYLGTDTDVHGSLAAVISSLKGISASRTDDQARIARAVQELSSVKTDASTADDAEENIEIIIDAIEWLKKLSVELPEIRLQLDRVLRFWEKQWVFLEPVSHREKDHHSLHSRPQLDLLKLPAP